MTSVPETKYAKNGDFHIAYQAIGQGPFRTESARKQTKPRGFEAGIAIVLTDYV